MTIICTFNLSPAGKLRKIITTYVYCNIINFYMMARYLLLAIISALTQMFCTNVITMSFTISRPTRTLGVAAALVAAPSTAYFT